MHPARTHLVALALVLAGSFAIELCEPGETSVKNHIKYQCFKHDNRISLKTVGCVPDNTAEGKVIEHGAYHFSTHFKYLCLQKGDTMTYVPKFCVFPEENAAEPTIWPPGTTKVIAGKGVGVCLEQNGTVTKRLHDEGCLYKGKIHESDRGKYWMDYDFKNEYQNATKVRCYHGIIEVKYCIARLEQGGFSLTVNYNKVEQSSKTGALFICKQEGVTNGTRKAFLQKLNAQCTHNGKTYTLNRKFDDFKKMLWYQCLYDPREQNAYVKLAGCIGYSATANDKDFTSTVNKPKLRRYPVGKLFKKGPNGLYSCNPDGALPFEEVGWPTCTGPDGRKYNLSFTDKPGDPGVRLGPEGVAVYQCWYRVNTIGYSQPYWKFTGCNYKNATYHYMYKQYEKPDSQNNIVKIRCEYKNGRNPEGGVRWVSVAPDGTKNEYSANGVNGKSNHQNLTTTTTTTTTTTITTTVVPTTTNKKVRTTPKATKATTQDRATNAASSRLTTKPEKLTSATFGSTDETTKLITNKPEKTVEPTKEGPTTSKQAEMTTASPGPIAATTNKLDTTYQTNTPERGQETFQSTSQAQVTTAPPEPTKEATFPPTTNRMDTTYAAASTPDTERETWEPTDRETATVTARITTVATLEPIATTNKPDTDEITTPNEQRETTVRSATRELSTLSSSHEATTQATSESDATTNDGDGETTEGGTTRFEPVASTDNYRATDFTVEPTTEEATTTISEEQTTPIIQQTTTTTTPEGGKPNCADDDQLMCEQLKEHCPAENSIENLLKTLITKVERIEHELSECDTCKEKSHADCHKCDEHSCSDHHRRKCHQESEKDCKSCDVLKTKIEKIVIKYCRKTCNLC